MNSFRSYQRALLTEVALLHAMAKDRADSGGARAQCRPGVRRVAARWSDDAGTYTRGGDAAGFGPRRSGSALGDRVQSLAAGSVTGVITTNRGFAIATVLERAMTRSISPSCWCWLLRWISTARRARRPGSQKFVDDREVVLRRAGRIELKVGNRASG